MSAATHYADFIAQFVPPGLRLGSVFRTALRVLIDCITAHPSSIREIIMFSIDTDEKVLFGLTPAETKEFQVLS